MGSLSPLDNSSLSFEYLQAPSGVEQNQEYSFFSDHLSPLSQEPTENAFSLPENSHNQPEMENEQEFKLFAPSEKPQPPQKTKLFADKTSESQAKQDDKPQTKKDGSKVSNENKNTESTQKKNPVKKDKNLQAATLKQTQHSVRAQENLALLKRNVKNILNKIPPSSQKPTTPSKGKAVLPKGATLRVESPNDFHVNQTTTKKSARNTSQTTLAHLANRSKHYDVHPQRTVVASEVAIEPQKKKR